MEKQYIKVADGREVRRGPWIQQRYDPCHDISFEVGIDLIAQAVIILKVKLRADFGSSITLPEVEIAQKELWTRELITEVIRVLRQSTIERGYVHGQVDVIEKPPRYKKGIEYVISILIRFEKEKELILQGGRKLIGGLEFSLDSSEESVAHNDLRIWGNMEEPNTKKTERINLFTIKDLYPLSWPGSNKKPTGIKNKEIWCKKLEFVVINYLNLLIDFAPSILQGQIAIIVRDLASRSEWAVMCHDVFQKLLNLDSGSREDQKIIRAFKLIEEVVRMR